MAERRSVGVLIVGGGPAGAACAETLRAEGYDGTVVLAGREPDPPYDRPPASKEYLRGEKDRDACRLRPNEWWGEQRIELLTRTSVMKLDAAERTARLSTGGEVAFEQALVATGANVRRLRVDGGQLAGIHYLRTLGNADAIRAHAEQAEHVVLVGGSFIACEVAASLTLLGRRCTLVMLEDSPLEAALGRRAGGFFASVLGERGVALVTGDEVERFEGAGDRVRAVLTRGGRRLPADLVVMGTGVIPDVMLARAAGLVLGDTGGVACSDRLETSASGVFAAGDVCEWESTLHGRRLRIEHWEVARAQGAHAARAILGSSEPFTEVPYFWSDLADWASLEYVGAAAGWDREIVRGSMDGGAFSVFYLRGGRVEGVLAVNRHADVGPGRDLVAAQVDVTGREDRLASEDADLAAIAASVAAGS